MKEGHILLSKMEAVGLIIAAAAILGIVLYYRILNLRFGEVQWSLMTFFSCWIVIRLSYFTIKGLKQDKKKNK